MPHVTVDNITPRTTIVVGGTPNAGPFTIPSTWGFFALTDFKVYNAGVELTYDASPADATEFSVAGNAVDGGYQGGTFTLGATVVSTTLILERNVPYARTEDFPYPSNTLNIRTLNTALDKIAAWAQQLFSKLTRTLRQPGADSVDLDELPLKAARQGKVFVWDANGQPDVSTLSAADLDDLETALTGAQTAATNAQTAETNAETAETNAETAQTAAEAARDAAIAAGGSVKVSANDTTPGTIEAKILVAGALTLSTQNDGGNETRTITANAALLRSDTSATLTKGFPSTANDLGTISSGTVTPDPANGHHQYYTDNGAHTLAPPTATGTYTMVIEITNGASAAAPTTSGFTKKRGATHTTTNGHKFKYTIHKGITGSLLVVDAMQ